IMKKNGNINKKRTFKDVIKNAQVGAYMSRSSEERKKGKRRLQKINKQPNNKIKSEEESEAIGNSTPQAQQPHPSMPQFITDNPSYQQKRTNLPKEWENVINKLAPKYNDIFAGNGPQRNAISITPVPGLCNCSEKDNGTEITYTEKYSFHYCKDDDAASVLLRHGFIVGSPEKPKIAFHLQLLRAFQILQPISNISYEGFAEFISTFQNERATASMHRNFSDAYIAYCKINLTVDARMRKEYSLEEEKCLACPKVTIENVKSLACIL
ncbi:hypothetical protein INT45_010247, partial [Circinella minor]